MRAAILLAIGIVAGAVIQSGVDARRAKHLSTPTIIEIASPQAVQEPWHDVEWFIPAMKAIAMMESSGGTNQKPNVDGIVGLVQCEKPFYQDAKEYAGGVDFPSYEDLQGYDEATFDASCVVTWYWMQRYKANTPYLMFCRFRKGPKGECTATGRAYADKAMRIFEK